MIFANKVKKRFVQFSLLNVCRHSVSRAVLLVLFVLALCLNCGLAYALTSAGVTDAAEQQDVSVPTTMIAGQQYSVFVTMLNERGKWEPFNEYALVPIIPVNNNVWRVTAIPLRDRVRATGSARQGLV